MTDGFRDFALSTVLLVKIKDLTIDMFKYI